MANGEKNKQIIQNIEHQEGIVWQKKNINRLFDMGSCKDPKSSVVADAGGAVDKLAAYQLLEFLRLFFMIVFRDYQGHTCSEGICT